MAAIIPRPSLIARLTLGHALPLDPIPPELMSVVMETIGVAWSELSAEGVTQLSGGDEAEVNAELKIRLNNYCETVSLWRDLVGSVALGMESVNFNGEKLEPRPDLSIMLYLRNKNFPLVIECKIIDHPNDKTVRHYCNNGIARFVSGDYAWGAREAVMLAYVRDGSTITGTLSSHLIKASAKTPDPFLTSVHPTQYPTAHPVAYRSLHERSFCYQSVVQGNVPGPIDLWHLWLQI